MFETKIKTTFFFFPFRVHIAMRKASTQAPRSCSMLPRWSMCSTESQHFPSHLTRSARGECNMPCRIDATLTLCRLRQCTTNLYFCGTELTFDFFHCLDWHLISFIAESQHRETPLHGHNTSYSQKNKSSSQCAVSLSGCFHTVNSTHLPSFCQQ